MDFSIPRVYFYVPLPLFPIPLIYYHHRLVLPIVEFHVNGNQKSCILCSVSLVQQNISESYPCCCNRNFFFFYYRLVFHGMVRSQFAYLFIWIFECWCCFQLLAIIIKLLWTCMHRFLCGDIFSFLWVITYV